MRHAALPQQNDNELISCCLRPLWMYELKLLRDELTVGGEGDES